MELCRACCSIPFESLPNAPNYEAGYHLVFDDRELVEYLCDQDKQPTSRDDIGLSWHNNVESLAGSAKAGCPLCVAVSDGIEAWKARYERGKTTEFYKEFLDDYEVDFAKEPLQLTKRFNDAHGLMVFTAHRRYNEQGRRYRGIIPLCSLAFSVYSTDPLSSGLPLRPPMLDSGSPESLDLVTGWLNHCAKTHESCSGAETPLPTRLLDVGGAAEDPIKLVEPEAGATGKFASLSYCWGSSLTVLTTQSSRQAHLYGIDLAGLPKTFHDAIRVTRHLGLRYLWIDSLCILQDDEVDWARESARMLDIFSNAYLVIAANHASDASEGCFHDRPPRVITVANIPSIGKVNLQSVAISDEISWGGFSFDEEPLGKRAWALQERVLARRTIHYSCRQMYFECNHGIVSEDGCRAANRYCDISAIRQKQESTKGIRETWNSILWSYGERNLSKRTDRYPALSGIARLCGNALGEDYIGGLWSGRLVQDLAWQGLGDKKHELATEYVGPSWSWSSYPAIAALSDYEDWRDIASIEGWDVQLRNKDDPYGQVASAYIKVRGPLTPLQPSSLVETEHEIRLKRAGMIPHPRVITKYSTDEEGEILSLDNREAHVYLEWLKKGIKVLLLGGHVWGEKPVPDQDKAQRHDKDFRVSYGLVLVPSRPGETDSEMRRIGWMFVDSSDTSMLRQTEEDWQTVTIV